MVLPPAVADIAHDGKRSESEIKDTGVHTLGWLLSQLLGRFGTNGALRIAGCMDHQHENGEDNRKEPLFHDHDYLGKISPFPATIACSGSAPG